MYMKAASKPAYDQLGAALDDTVPDCAGDGRYIADHLTNSDKQDMSEVCGACPLLTLCSTYAATERPGGGWWPGTNLKIRRNAA